MKIQTIDDRSWVLRSGEDGIMPESGILLSTAQVVRLRRVLDLALESNKDLVCDVDYHGWNLDISITGEGSQVLMTVKLWLGGADRYILHKVRDSKDNFTSLANQIVTRLSLRQEE